MTRHDIHDDELEALEANGSPCCGERVEFEGERFELEGGE